MLLNNLRAPLLHPDNLLAWMSCRRMSSASQICMRPLGKEHARSYTVGMGCVPCLLCDCSPRCRRCSSILLYRCKCHAAARTISRAVQQALEPYSSGTISPNPLALALLAALQPVSRVPVSAQLAPAPSSVPLRRGQQAALARLAGSRPLRSVHRMTPWPVL